MPRLPRVYIPKAVYFVTLEGPAKEPIFMDDQDYAQYLEFLNQYKQEYRFKVFSYALFSDRLHLALEVHEEFPISLVMQKLTPHYTKYYNHRYGRRGPLFQKRFHSVIVEKENYLLSLTRYIHLLPVERALVKNFREYPYTSYQEFHTCQTNAEHPLQMKEEIQEVLAGLASAHFEDAYERYILSAEASELEFLRKKLFRGAYLGSDEFIVEVKKKMLDRARRENAPQMEEFIPSSGGGKGTFVVSPRTVALSWLLVLTMAFSAFSVYWNFQTQSASLRSAALLGGKAISKSKIARLPDGQASSALPPRNDGVKDVPLNGTIWEVQLVSVSPEGVETPIRDSIKFTGEAFESYYFSSRGFSRSNYSITVNDNGIITWETIQKNDKGEIISWRGDLQGNRMEGMLSYQPSEGTVRDFQFMSNRGMVQK